MSCIAQSSWSDIKVEDEIESGHKYLLTDRIIIFISMDSMTGILPPVSVIKDNLFIRESLFNQDHDMEFPQRRKNQVKINYLSNLINSFIKNRGDIGRYFCLLN